MGDVYKVSENVSITELIPNFEKYADIDKDKDKYNFLGKYIGLDQGNYKFEYGQATKESTIFKVEEATLNNTIDAKTEQYLNVTSCGSGGGVSGCKTDKIREIKDEGNRRFVITDVNNITTVHRGFYSPPPVEHIFTLLQKYFQGKLYNQVGTGGKTKRNKHKSRKGKRKGKISRKR